MKQIIHAEMVYLRKSDFNSSWIDNIKRRLTVKSVFDNRTVQVYKEDEDMIGVPRYFRLPTSMDDQVNIVDYRTPGTAKEILFTGRLRDHQVAPMVEYRGLLNNGTTGVLMDAQTGSGKTVMAACALSILKCTTLVIVPKSDLMDQWRDRLVTFTNLKEEDIGYAYQDTCDYEGKTVVIGMLHSLCRDKYSENFTQYFGAVIGDEVHRFSATEFSQAIMLFPAKYRLGLSASLERKDGTSVVFYLHMGRDVIKVAASQPKPEIYVFNYTGHSGVIPKYLFQTQQRRGSLLTMLSMNKDRSKTLANLTKRLADSGRQTALLSERKTLLVSVRNYLITEYGFTDKEVGIYIHRTPKAEKERIIRECSIILATSKMLSEGTDIPSLRALIFATPMSDVLQPVGRVRRLDPRYKTPIVLDFVDTRYKETVKWASNRRRWYTEQNFTVKTM